MPRSIEEILAHADELAARFEEGFEPREVNETDAIEGLQRAVVELSNAQKNVALWVDHARRQKKSWETIGEALGTSGEAARQRYGQTRLTVPNRGDLARSKSMRPQAATVNLPPDMPQELSKAQKRRKSAAQRSVRRAGSKSI